MKPFSHMTDSERVGHLAFACFALASVLGFCAWAVWATIKLIP